MNDDKLKWADLLRKFLSERTDVTQSTHFLEEFTMACEPYEENTGTPEFLREFLQEVSMLRTGQPHWGNPMCMPGNDTVH
jgi:hypothetical protein